MFDLIAWSGGSAPPKVLPEQVRQLAVALYVAQCQTYKDYWGDLPTDVSDVFKGRANYDAWATLRNARGGRKDKTRNSN